MYVVDATQLKPTPAAKPVHPNSRTAPQGKAGHFQDLGHSSTFIGWHELHHQSRLQIIRHILRRYRTLPAPHPQASRTTWPPFFGISWASLTVAKRAARRRARNESITVGVMAPWVSRGLLPQDDRTKRYQAQIMNWRSLKVCMCRGSVTTVLTCTYHIWRNHQTGTCSPHASEYTLLCVHTWPDVILKCKFRSFEEYKLYTCNLRRRTPELMEKTMVVKIWASWVCYSTSWGSIDLGRGKKKQQLLRASLLTTRVNLNPRMHPTAMYEASRVVVSSQSNIEELNSPPLETSWNPEGEW